MPLKLFGVQGEEGCVLVHVGRKIGPYYWVVVWFLVNCHLICCIRQLLSFVGRILLTCSSGRVQQREREGSRRQSKGTREAGGRTRSDGRRKRERERMKGKRVSEVYRRMEMVGV